MDTTIKPTQTQQPITISQKAIDRLTAVACLSFFPVVYLIGNFFMG